MSNFENPGFKAAIIDMDGVITQTAGLHAKAWKQIFDEFLKEEEGDDFQPLDIEEDYKKYIDGIPRFDGVRNFLRSRNIELPEGKPGDELGSHTVHGLGKHKNKIFLEVLDKEGVHVYRDTLDIVKKWKKEDIKLAVISSSRNCKFIIESAGLSELFDVRVDGETAKEENIKGKPEPDIFFKACELLGTEINQTIVIEDAIAGVEAGRKGKFAVVVGVARNGEEMALRDAGADIVVKELTQIEDKIKEFGAGNNAEDLPDALKEIEEVFEIVREKTPCLFLDYDGTLTPIVSNPDEARLSDKTRKILIDLSRTISIAVISGRDRKDLVSKLEVSNLIYAGSHGFDITGPNNLEMQYAPGLKTLPALDEAEKHLREKLKDFEGIKIERKKYAIAVHFRNVAEDNIKDIDKAVYEEIDQQEKLKIGVGKKILELKPDLDWNKGRALIWIMETLELNEKNYLPIVIGDDITDEDAFEAVSGKGIGIIVGSHGHKTSASYRLNSPDEVVHFLEHLKNTLKKNKQEQK